MDTLSLFAAHSKRYLPKPYFFHLSHPKLQNQLLKTLFMPYIYCELKQTTK